MRCDEKMQVPLPADLKARVRAAARENDRTLAAFARQALTAHCERVEALARTRAEAAERAARDPRAVKAQAREPTADESIPTVARLDSGASS
jgi:predicted DNA-binding protein